MSDKKDILEEWNKAQNSISVRNLYEEYREKVQELRKQNANNYIQLYTYLYSVYNRYHNKQVVHESQPMSLTPQEFLAEHDTYEITIIKYYVEERWIGEGTEPSVPFPALIKTND